MKYVIGIKENCVGGQDIKVISEEHYLTKDEPFFPFIFMDEVKFVESSLLEDFLNSIE